MKHFGSKENAALMLVSEIAWRARAAVPGKFISRWICDYGEDDLA